jgi:hypothetical protein
MLRTKLARHHNLAQRGSRSESMAINDEVRRLQRKWSGGIEFLDEDGKAVGIRLKSDAHGS